MIEVGYGGGGHRTWLRDQEINCYLYGVPPGHVYKGVEEGAGQGGWRALGGSPTTTGSRTPLLGVGEGRKRKEGGRKGGAGPPPNSDWAWGGAPSLAPFPSFPLRPNKAHIPPGGFR